MSEKFSKASLRGLRTKERMEKMRAQVPPGIPVVPANDDGRRLLKHPKGGGFPKEGSATWPNDTFTRRRLADGSIRREGEKREPDKSEQRRPRQQKDEPNTAA
jgi:hypothetical protein